MQETQKYRSCQEEIPGSLLTMVGALLAQDITVL